MISRGSVPQSINPLVRYVNVTINNPGNIPNKTVTFDTTYDRSILNVCGENLCAVVNFSLPLQSLPLFIFPIEPNQANSRKSRLQVGVCHNVSAAQIAAGAEVAVTGNSVALTWQPQELGLAIPTQNQTTQVVTPYYYCYSYEHFVNLTNDAVQSAWTNEATPGGPGNYPRFRYNEDQHTFSWIVPTAFSGNVGGGAADGWSVCWNEDFDNLVNNFNTINTGGQFILEDTLSALTNTVSGNIILSQDYPTTDSFNSAQRIICLTNSIPIAADYFAAPYNQSQYGGSGLSNTEKVLVDIPLDFDNNVGAQRSVLVYNPGIYQISDMESSLPLTRINVKFMWCDSLNNFYEIPLKESDTVTIKLGFFSKRLPFV